MLENSTFSGKLTDPTANFLSGLKISLSDYGRSSRPGVETRQTFKAEYLSGSFTAEAIRKILTTSF